MSATAREWCTKDKSAAVDEQSALAINSKTITKWEKIVMTWLESIQLKQG